ncbi:MAG: hypothetical protein G01um101491_472 [Parcubacteria group bacterium Gr01-1014_91]|nr:MAG: hypothetical protein G01um101491_472 [Parcubacteria group bacterium Gr01-1014_91]
MEIEVSAAEKDGLSLETRCELALVALRRHWETLQTISTQGLYQEREARKRNALILEGLEGTMREEMTRTLADADRVFAGARADVLSTFWNAQVRFLRDLFGADAIDFAMKATKRERLGN